ncbi:MAG: hypothetical protein F4077_07495 [Gammaproteobacteria bacterium]|nr:hypothetical protein [Gammaproteobacteria bacterium]MYI77588.1 hypothetical protein [Gammaproteobacteria bacterium]
MDFDGLPNSVHHNVFFKFKDLNEEYIRGFYSDSTQKALNQITKYMEYQRLRDSGADPTEWNKAYSTAMAHIPGTVRDLDRSGGSRNVQQSYTRFGWWWWPWNSNHQHKYKQFSELEWTSFNVFTANCQDWADAVLN